jgi:hypothetical protein
MNNPGNGRLMRPIEGEASSRSEGLSRRHFVLGAGAGLIGFGAWGSVGRATAAAARGLTNGSLVVGVGGSLTGLTSSVATRNGVWALDSVVDTEAEVVRVPLTWDSALSAVSGNMFRRIRDHLTWHAFDVVLAVHGDSNAGRTPQAASRFAEFVAAAVSFLADQDVGVRAVEVWPRPDLPGPTHLDPNQFGEIISRVEEVLTFAGPETISGAVSIDDVNTLAAYARVAQCDYFGLEISDALMSSLSEEGTAGNLERRLAVAARLSGRKLWVTSVPLNHSSHSGGQALRELQVLLHNHRDCVGAVTKTPVLV